MFNIKSIVPFLVLVIISTACSNDDTGANITNESNGENLKKESTTVEEAFNPKEIDIIIADNEGALSDFSEELISDILQEVGVQSIEYAQFPTFHDEKIALSMGELSIIPGVSIHSTNHELALSMTYFHDVENNDDVAFGMDSGNKEFLSIINEKLMDMKENGKYKQLYQKYFDVQEEKAEVTEKPIEVIKEDQGEPVQEDMPKDVIVVEQEPEAESEKEESTETEVNVNSEKTEKTEETEPEEITMDPVVAYIDLFNWGGYLITDFLVAYHEDNGDVMGQKIWEMSDLVNEIGNATPPEYLANTHSNRQSKANEALSLMEGYIDYNWQHGYEVEQDRIDRLAAIGNEFAMMK